jgi:hypothetical protein
MTNTLVSKIEEALSKINTSIGKADVRLKAVQGGTVVVSYRKPPSSLGVCHPDKSQATQGLVAEILEDELKSIMPDFERLVVEED